MNKGFLMEYLEKTDVFIQIRNLLNNLCGLDLYLFDDTGKLLNFNPRTETNLLDIPPKTNPAEIRVSVKKIHRVNDLSLLYSDILITAIDSKQPQIFTCEKGFRKILMPIILDEDVVGFFFTGESSNFRLNGMQINSIVLLLQKVTEKIIKQELKSFSEFKGDQLTHQQKIIKKVVNYIWDNYHIADISLHDISKKNGISYHYLSRIFKKELKTSFAQYRNKVRLDVASKLLKDRSLTVSQISYSCGFEDPGYFCKVFKENFGFSPVNYRKKNYQSKRIEECAVKTI